MTRTRLAFSLAVVIAVMVYMQQRDREPAPKPTPYVVPKDFGREPLHRAPYYMAEKCRQQGKVYIAWRQDFDEKWQYECLEPRVARWFKEQPIPH